VLRDGLITGIGRGLDEDADTVIDARGTTVMPGLIDSHVHPVFGDFTPRQRTTDFLDSALNGGVTTAISAGEVHLPGRPRDVVGLKALGAALEQRSEQEATGLARRLDFEFHRLLGETARNPVYAVLTHVLMELESEVMQPPIPLTEEDSLRLDAAHRRIFEAVAARRAVEAREAMAAHIDDVQARVDREALTL